MKKETEEVKKVGQVSNKTQAFLDWYNSGLTKTVNFHFTDRKAQRSFASSIMRYTSKHGINIETAFSVDHKIFTIFRTDEIGKYKGSVNFIVCGKDDILFNAFTMLLPKKKGKKNG